MCEPVGKLCSGQDSKVLHGRFEVFKPAIFLHFSKEIDSFRVGDTIVGRDTIVGVGGEGVVVYGEGY